MDSSALQSQLTSASVESGKAMGSAVKGAGDDGTTDLFKLNQVYYRMPPTLSLVSKRTITRCNFQQVGYAAPLNQRVASAIFNTGEFQVCGKTSFLVIQGGIPKNSPLLPFMTQGNGVLGGVNAAAKTAKWRASGRALLGQGGIMNLFEEVTFMSASGTEVDRQQNKGLQAAHVTRNRMDLDWFNTVGESQGYPGGSYQDCYDRKGAVGYVQDFAGGGAANSPMLMPIRGIWSSDWSKESLALLNAAANTNGVQSTVWDNTRSITTGLDEHVGSVDVSYDPVFDATANPTPGGPLTFVVPLCELLGMFCPYMNALIPSQELAGGRLEIRFKNMTEALIATGPVFNTTQNTGAGEPFDAATSIANANAFLSAFQIDNIYMLLDSFQMNDSVLKKLNEIAAGSEGLSVMFDTWDWTQTPFANLSGEAQVSQARSRILRSFCVTRDSLMISHPFGNSLASEAAFDRFFASTKNYNLVPTANGFQLLVNLYQAQLGSLYFPQQPLQSVEEYAMNAYYVFCKSYQNYDECNAVSLSDFIGARGEGLFNNGALQPPISVANAVLAVGWTDVNRQWNSLVPRWCINWGSATYGFLAERSQLLQLTGLPISNARLLRHRFVFNYPPESGAGRLVDCFTEYTRVAKVFLGGRIVMRE